MKLKKYKGVSLIEMLITIVILTVVMLLVSVVLTTLIRTAAVTNARTTSRQESEFVIEILRKNIRNSHTDDMVLYSVSNRAFDEEQGKVIDTGLVSGYSTPVAEGTEANVVHFRPNGYHRWVCIGYFPLSTDPTKGYVVKSSYPDNVTPSECFNSNNTQYQQNALILNSSEVYASGFGMRYYSSPSGNKLVTIDLTMKSIRDMSFSKNVKPEYYKQALVSTQKLTWE